MQNEKYDEMKRRHPEWSDDQIWTAIAMGMQVDVELDKGGEDVKEDDPDFIAEILKGAKQWLEEVLPDVFARVSKFFNDLLNTIGEWVAKGLNYVFEAISILLGRKY